MKIVSIFGQRLYAFHLEGERYNELKRVLHLWSDTKYLFQFLNENKSDLPRGESIEDLIIDITSDANGIDTILQKLASKKSSKLEEFFKPLNNQEFRLVNISKQKGRKNYLRIYAIRIDTNCFIITGGAIKFTHLMQDRQHTAVELTKIEKLRNYLRENTVTDADSFYEFTNE